MFNLLCVAAFVYIITCWYLQFLSKIYQDELMDYEDDINDYLAKSRKGASDKVSDIMNLKKKGSPNAQFCCWYIHTLNCMPSKYNNVHLGVIPTGERI